MKEYRRNIVTILLLVFVNLYVGMTTTIHVILWVIIGVMGIYTLLKVWPLPYRWLIKKKKGIENFQENHSWKKVWEEHNNSSTK